MNKIHLLLISSLLILSTGIFLSVFWWFTYSFVFGSCTILSYNIGPGMNCEFNSILDCSSSYCANLFVFFSGTYNYTSFIPISFHDDTIDPYSCWNLLSFLDLKSYLESKYPIGSLSACYINFDYKLILSEKTFYQTTSDIWLAGIILTSTGCGILAVYILSFYFLRKRDPPAYQVL